ncbi:uncharacterized protein LOC111701581 [Eurytemora carolleeae]|uniref:uncharacterized protein LOC111701581 n=1 Tax=Eurytemora carolleeae TaxID=1294199 RepID=UPI000C75BF1F|nr:uncharacterized protein LOC111701581 [Eurytemora carolleeae]|eukprot:XP_023328693.1 uncharacterized protein LOC111701581 [Eurytemora affinis]
MLGKVIIILGHAYCGVVGVIVTYFIRFMEYVARNLIAFVEMLTGATFIMPELPKARVKVDPIYQEKDNEMVDEPATLRDSPFPIKESDLINKCKDVIKAQFGCDKQDLLADDFLFVFPVVGPLSKKDFVEIFSSFKMSSSLTGSPNYFNFSVDPMEPNRVWFFSRSVLKHTGDLIFGHQVIKPTGKTIVSPPQVLSMSFNEEGQCYKFTGGYSVDRTVGNTGGLGGLFGILQAVGSPLPFPEGQPWTPSLAWQSYAKHFPNIPKVWKS